MDSKHFNYLDWHSIFNFLKRHAKGDKQYLPSKRRVNGIFRRLDIDADAKIAFNEFAEAIKPIDVYFTDVDDLNLKEVSPKKYGEKEMQELRRQLRSERE
jgi:Ca2+-binding EF-hand superfamily protein